MRHEEGGLIYLTGSIDLWAKQFPTFLGQVLHLLSSALSGGLKGKNVGEGKVQGRNSPAIELRWKSASLAGLFRPTGRGSFTAEFRAVNPCVDAHARPRDRGRRD